VKLDIQIVFFVCCDLTELMMMIYCWNYHV